MPESAGAKDRSTQAEVERQDSICGAIDRCLTHTLGLWGVAYDATDMVRNPAGDPVDLLTGSHLAWAAGYAHLARSVLAAFGDRDALTLSETEIARLFGVSRKVMMSRSNTLAKAGHAHFLRARKALNRLIDGKTPTVGRVLGAFASYPLPSGWPWPGDTYADGEFIAGVSPEIETLGSVVDLILDGKHTSEAYEPRRAAHLLKGVLALDPDQYDAYSVLSMVLVEYWRAVEARKYEDIAFRRCMVRITMPDGRWPERISSEHNSNVPILRTIIKKAGSLWQRKQIEDALELLRRVLRVDPRDNLLAACRILALRLGMRYETFRDRLAVDEDLSETEKWFKANFMRFPEEFDEWMTAISAMQDEQAVESPEELYEPLYYRDRPETVN